MAGTLCNRGVMIIDSYDPRGSPIKRSAASPHGLYRMGYTCNIRDYTNKKYKIKIFYTKQI
jgi:hypothetical protein